MKYFFSAGEHSGDMHAANIIHAIKEIDKQAEIQGMGGPQMKKEGAEILLDPTRESTIGFWEAGKLYFRFKRYLKYLESFLKENPPNVLVWVDFGGFNLRLAQLAKNLSIPVVCIFSGSVWAYGKKRAEKMRDCVTHLLAVLPFERDFFQEYGMKVTYIGHPLIDKVKADKDQITWREEHGVRPNDQVVLIMPGSRKQEIINLLPTIVEASIRFAEQKDDISFFLPVASVLEKNLVQDLIKDLPIKISTIEEKEVYNLMSVADFGIIASGTATLEAAIMNLPMIVVYKVSPISAFIYRLLQNKETKDKPILVALPNIIAGGEIVPELIQDRFNANSLSSLMNQYYYNKEKREAIRNKLKQITNCLGEPNIYEKAALNLVKVAENKEL